jgi:hypothetical protein
MSFRRAARTDANQTEIVKKFRSLGWYVLIVSQLKNCCDIIVSKDRVTVAIEIKDGDKPPSAQKLSEGEQKFRAEWQGYYELVNSIECALKIEQHYKEKIKNLK